MRKVKKTVCLGIIVLITVPNLIGLSNQNQVNAAWTPKSPGWNVNVDAEKKSACVQLQKDGFTKIAAAGIMGNILTESGMNPYKREGIGNHFTYGLGVGQANRLDPDNDSFGPGRGLIQWGDGTGTNGAGGSRWLSLVNYVNKKFGKNYPQKSLYAWNDNIRNQESIVRAEWPSVAEQVSFIQQEMNSGGYGSIVSLNASATPETAAKYFHDNFVRSYEYKSERGTNARDIYNRFCNELVPQITPVSRKYADGDNVRINKPSWLLGGSKAGNTKIGDADMNEQNYSIVQVDSYSDATHPYKISNGIVSGWVKEDELTIVAPTLVSRKFEINQTVTVVDGSWLLSKSRHGQQTGTVIASKLYTIVDIERYSNATHAYKISDGTTSGWVREVELKLHQYKFALLDEVTVTSGSWLITTDNNGDKQGDAIPNKSYKIIGRSSLKNATHPYKISDGTTSGWVRELELTKVIPQTTTRKFTKGTYVSVTPGAWLVSNEKGAIKSGEVESTLYQIVEVSPYVNAEHPYKISDGYYVGWVKEDELTPYIQKYNVGTVVTITPGAYFISQPENGTKIEDGVVGEAYRIVEIAPVTQLRAFHRYKISNGISAGWVQEREITPATHRYKKNQIVEFKSAVEIFDKDVNGKKIGNTKQYNSYRILGVSYYTGSVSNYLVTDGETTGWVSETGMTVYTFVVNDFVHIGTGSWLVSAPYSGTQIGTVLSSKQTYRIIEIDNNEKSTHPYKVTDGEKSGWVRLEELTRFKFYLNQTVTVRKGSWLITSDIHGEKLADASNKKQYTIIGISKNIEARHQYQITDGQMTGWVQAVELTDAPQKYALQTIVSLQPGAWLVSNFENGTRGADPTIGNAYRVTEVATPNFTHRYRISNGASSGWVQESEIALAEYKFKADDVVTIVPGSGLFDKDINGNKQGSTAAHTYRITGVSYNTGHTQDYYVTDNVVSGWVKENTLTKYTYKVNDFVHVGKGSWLLSTDKVGVQVGTVISDVQTYKIIKISTDVNVTHRYQVTDGVSTGWVREGELSQFSIEVNQNVQVQSGSWLMSADISGVKSGEVVGNKTYRVISISTNNKSIHTYKITDGVSTGWVRPYEVIVR